MVFGPASMEEVRHELSRYATKEDVAQMETRIIKWMVGVMIAGMAVAASLAALIASLINQ